MIKKLNKKGWSGYAFDAVSDSRWFHPLLLLVWVAIGASLRFSHLASKAPWTDEFATIVFSLGHSFRTVPLDRVLTLDVLLQPLQNTPPTGIGDVMHHLMAESTHPPVYFLLAHLWMGLFPTEQGIASIWAARSLPALFGVASIPAIFGLSCLAFRSRLAGQMAAAMMAVSPFGIFLAQDARHYTLATLLVIASVCCLIIATRAVHHRTLLPIWVGLAWVAINTLGVATHYFFTLTLCTEALVLIAQGVRLRWWKKRTWLQSHWWRIYLVAAGTLIGGLVWLPFWRSSYGSELTKWIYDGEINWLEPIGRFLAWAITMLVSLPMETSTLPSAIVFTSGLVTVIFLLWALPILNRGLKIQSSQLDNRLSVQVLREFVLGTLVLFCILTYGLGADLTLAPRYIFLYFPVAIALIGASLATYWNPTLVVQTQPVRPLSRGGKKVVMLIWLMGFIGGLTVVGNLGYLQNNRSDLLVNVIQKVSHSPILIATTHKHHGQTGRMMGLAWQFLGIDRSGSSTNGGTPPQFLLAHKAQGVETPRNPSATLQEAVAGLPKPLDVWLVDFRAGVELQQQNCFADSQSLPKLNGYKYKLYHCEPE